MPTVRLTEARINTLKPGKSARDFRDTALKGFGVRIMPSGRKRFFLHTQHEGRRIWKLIGEPGQMALDEARDAARTELTAIRKGQPAAKSPEDTLFEAVAEEVFLRYSRHWKPSTLKVNRGYLRKQILPWFGGRQIEDITRKDVQDWFISLHATPVAADRSAPVLSVIMTQAEVYGYRPENSNPCTGIRRYRRKGRERLLTDAELRRLGGVLSTYETDQPLQTAIIRILLLTGCRGSEIRTLQWRDFRNGHLYLRDSKTGPRTVWLSSPSRDVLAGLPRTSRWVFPSQQIDDSVSKTVVTRFWWRVRSDAGLPDVRLHDLRHAYASIAIMQGETVPVVGRLLGHNDAGTTLKYTHLAESNVRDAADAVGAILGGTES
ncbi:MAG: site-specific integrase [Rhodobacteraceae bacterium]|nr:site-specific integrase [Paracoccaceae bacterium]MCY4139111.1 site-specific integrase [Paracoccaceae bacterium]